ncbi:MAG: hypothetical protein HYR68_05095 [Burkholderiales bacterium]|nr:hypothetical protein [Burkholderiales bacterium]
MPNQIVRASCLAPDTVKLFHWHTWQTQSQLSNLTSSVMHADWHFHSLTSREEQTIRVLGNWLTDNGELAHDWAIAGLGLVSDLSGMWHLPWQAAN